MRHEMTRPRCGWSAFVVVVALLVGTSTAADRTGLGISGGDQRPTNLTDLFKGPWVNLREGGTFNHITGNFLVDKIVVLPTQVDGIASVEAMLTFRDGIYSSDTTTKYHLQGIYLQKPGALLLIGIPENSVEFTNISIPLEYSSDSIGGNNVESILKLFLESMLPTSVNSSNTKCLLKLGFSVRFYDPNENFLSHLEPDWDVDDKDAATLIVWRGYIASQNCEFYLDAEAAELLESAYFRPLMNYLIVLYIVSFVETYFLAKQMDAASTQATAVKISEWTINLNALLDSYLCFLHLAASFVFKPLFYPFAIASFIQFVKFSLFEMRLLLAVRKARNPALFAQGIETVRTEVSLMYWKLYAMLFGGLLLFYYFQSIFMFIVAALYSFWIPQIASNAYYGHSQSLLTTFTLATSICRLFIPVYFTGYNNNFMRFEPQHNVALLFVGYVVFQFIVLYSQDLLGPRFFIPAKCLPPKYNYHRPVPATELRESDCVICMCKLQPDAADIETGGAPVIPANSPLAERARQEMQRGTYMITPCNHMFHTECLMQWMEYKLECPTCRSALPVL
ncbi:zinc finger family protein [Pelomyxa schiedti]|nr:zinc finger family protein [Pelomyxa schiedti]